MNESYKNPKLFDNLVAQIREITKNLQPINIMEVCGSHTMAIAKFGLSELLPKNIKLISGPGCPVCVTPNKSIDKIIALSKLPNVIITSFGDMIRVPGSTSSLANEKSKGADIRIVYSSLDALKIAKENPEKKIIFYGVGFETTTPTTAATILKAKNDCLQNFSVFCAHKNMPNALRLLLNNSQNNINGFILPGHVSTIIGKEPFEFIANKHKIPGVISGFEALEILLAIKQIVTQIKNNEAKIENAYSRAVKTEGNIAAKNIINEVFSTCDSEWRGLGVIKDSGYKINEKFSNYNAENLFDCKVEKNINNSKCMCGEVLQGIITPKECPLYKTLCNPQNPIGPCMVSSEGTCAAYYKYKA